MRIYFGAITLDHLHGEICTVALATLASSQDHAKELFLQAVRTRYPLDRVAVIDALLLPEDMLINDERLMNNVNKK